MTSDILGENHARALICPIAGLSNGGRIKLLPRLLDDSTRSNHSPHRTINPTYNPKRASFESKIGQTTTPLKSHEQQANGFKAMLVSILVDADDVLTDERQNVRKCTGSHLARYTSRGE